MRASDVAQHGCCLHKSSRVPSEKSHSWQRVIYHGGGAGVEGLNASRLESVQELRSVLVGRACVGGGTPLSWNPCRLVGPTRLKGTSFPTVQDGRRSHESNASLRRRQRRSRTPRSWMETIERRRPTLLDDAHDLQGRSAQDRVLGRRQRRSRSLATTDREENTVRKATDVHPVLLIPMCHN